MVDQNTPNSTTSTQKQSQGYSQEHRDEKRVVDVEALRPQSGSFNHAFDGENIRGDWQSFFSALNSVGSSNFKRMQAEMTRLLRENGVIYSSHEDLSKEKQNWVLDPLPILISADEWAGLEDGLAQRAELFSVLIHDLYGNQESIKRGLLPPELIFSHRHYLRPMVANYAISRPTLPLFSCDLSRGPDGRYWVLNDLAQSPVGVGRALENRLMMSNFLSDEFRLMRTQRIARYFKALKATLSAVSPRITENPRIVVLYPKDCSETLFEQSYLASYLGYHFVQGDDLTVQDGKVWLKSLDGLQRVDVILRHVSDWDCDPVELNPNSLAGIPGLLGALRQKNVAIVNPIGCGLLENPGIYPFLNGVSRHFLNEELHLPTVNTWWCGQAKACDEVLDRLPEMLIKSIDGHRPSVCGKHLDAKEQLVLQNEIREAPYRFVGQEYARLARSPSLVNDTLESSRVKIRSFVSLNTTRDGGKNYVVMPGGIAHVIDKSNIHTLQSHISKDVWVARSENAAVVPEIDARSHKVFNTERIKELDSAVPSRAAESLFWAGRYIERAEHIARLLRALIKEVNNYSQQQDSSAEEFLQILQNSLQLNDHVDLEQLDKTSPAEFSVKKAFNEIRALIADQTQAQSLSLALKNFTKSAFQVRDLWSSDTWRTIHSINEERSALSSSPINRFSWQTRIDSLLFHLMSFLGLVGESMVQENSWRMFEIGRKIERLSVQSNLLKYYFRRDRTEYTESMLAESGLQLFESLIVHRRRYRSSPTAESALELLLAEPNNPRSVIHQVEKLRVHVDALPTSDKSLGLTRAQSACLRASTLVRLLDLEEVCQTQEGQRPHLSAFFDALSHETTLLSEELAHKYFSHTQRSQQLVDPLEAGVILNARVGDEADTANDAYNESSVEKIKGSGSPSEGKTTGGDSEAKV